MKLGKFYAIKNEWRLVRITEIFQKWVVMQNRISIKNMMLRSATVKFCCI